MKSFSFVFLTILMALEASAQSHACSRAMEKPLPFGVLIDAKDSLMMVAEWFSPDSAKSAKSAEAQVSSDMGAMLATLVRDPARLERVPNFGWRIKPGKLPLTLLTSFPGNMRIGTYREGGGFCTYATLKVAKKSKIRVSGSPATKSSRHS